ncbi:c-type cytochrome [Oceaniglobus trochenteri]|uniref:c-type cytochrome n=1 Tax=Oceaniglobus trochenteri TaxID=2763260 RepID=UPI001FD943AC|nr:cytochrome c [Oceaniglobus trochenteri]
MIRLALAATTLATLAACVPPPAEVGRGLYAESCTACHGATGKGDGDLAGNLGKPVPDLTQLSARNGGTFPRTYVMGVIDGFSREGDPHSVMPEFGAGMEDDMLVPVDTGDGRATPTPAPLVALAAYLERLQE